MPTAKTKALSKKSAAKSRISIALCFDENLWMHAGVAIASLLYNANGAAYDIYCVVPSYFADARRRELSTMVANMNKDAKLIFLDANHDFDNSFVNGLTIGAYFRLMLVKLLPASVKKVIYCDCDVVFCDSLAEMYSTNLGNNFIAAVPDVVQGYDFPAKKNGYINSGVLIMNLDEIRKNDLYPKWVHLAKGGEITYMDQDIINKTCDGRILYLPARYNYMPGPGGRYTDAINQGIYTADEVFDARVNPAIIHFILRRPWLGHDNKATEEWWRYAAMTPFYAAFRARVDTTPDVMTKNIMLFAAIPILKIKYSDNNVRGLLFGKIPLWRSKHASKKYGL